MKAICKSQQMLDELEQMENKDKLQSTINEFQKNIAFMIEFTMQQPQFFFKFAYEIRKYDSTQKNNDYFTKKIIIEDKVLDQVWKDIIISNRWVQVQGEEKQRMIVDFDTKFSMQVGQDFKYSLRQTFLENTNALFELLGTYHYASTNDTASSVDAISNSPVVKFTLTEYGFTIGLDIKIEDTVSQVRLLSVDEVTSE